MNNNSSIDKKIKQAQDELHEYCEQFNETYKDLTSKECATKFYNTPKTFVLINTIMELVEQRNKLERGKQI